jgi:hypothetical protein
VLALLAAIPANRLAAAALAGLLTSGVLRANRRGSCAVVMGGVELPLGGVDVIQEWLLIPDGVLQLEFCASHARGSQDLHGGNVAFSSGDTDPGCREVGDRFSCIPPP